MHASPRRGLWRRLPGQRTDCTPPPTGWSRLAGAPLVIYTPASQALWRVGAPATNPVWLPDSHAVLFVEANSIRLANLRTHSVSTVFTQAGADLHGRFALSPDGRSLYLVQMEDEEDVWLGGN